MIYKEALPDGETVRVTFEMPSSLWAERVNLVGDFNDWDTTKDELAQSRATGKLPHQRPRLAQRLARRQVRAEQIRLRQFRRRDVTIFTD